MTAPWIPWTGDQIVAYVRRARFRVVVTEDMVLAAISTLRQPFTCHDVVEAIPRDDRGCTVSQYLVALWIDDLAHRHKIRWTGARRPMCYEAMS